MSTPPAAPTATEAPDLSELVAEVVLAVPGVAALHAGPSGTVATYLPRRRVTGVAVRTDGGRPSVEVCVVAAPVRGLRTDLAALAARVRRAVGTLVPLPVDVTVADLADRTDLDTPLEGEHP
ncbi:hypothetical protein [Quadrisphaera setariae]|uniref:Asp23 family, cell envelope-related function n=1 Tax=Quadrisphaera setariae TaxID=2593304 RepID=A0A5C8ZH00_9ACTN|nr:hypothetical protein [Quadrisphaera setariae]TXR56120.1 hypothetical protein FMM08_11865 [Quadrisphaera setariae]